MARGHERSTIFRDDGPGS